MNFFLKGFMIAITVITVRGSEYTNPHNSAGSGTVGGTKKRGMNSTNSPCNQEMMLAYGLSGETHSTANVHPYCPSVQDNCCSAMDAELSMKYWLSEPERKLEAYYESYLYSLKYLLGFAQEVDKLADEMEKPEQSSDCREAAKDFKSMNWNPQIVEEIFRSFVQALEAMGEVRKGFYCVLCDVNTQNKLKDYWSIANLAYKDRIYFSKEFCEELVDNTIRASYYQAFYLKRYLTNAVELMSCKNGIRDVPSYDVSYWARKQVELCYQFKNKQMFFFCEDYCENFHLTRGNDILDGNVKQLSLFVSYFKENKDKSFFDSDNNFLLGSLGYVEEFILENHDGPGEDLVFFRPTTSQIQLDKFKTDVVYNGGFNPFDSTESSLYPLYLSSVKIMTLGGIVVLMKLLL